jgi:hypothetical protein
MKVDNLQALLDEQGKDIVLEASDSIKRAGLKHYGAAGRDVVEQRLATLFDTARQCVAKRSLTPIIRHAETVARERFSAGYDLTEVQLAFNVLEEAIWKRILAELEPRAYAEALGSISTVLGAGKDMLARTYVSLAAQTKVPSLNLTALFTGPED